MFYRMKSNLLSATTGLQDVSHAGVYLTTGSALPSDTPTPFRFTVEVDEPAEEELAPKPLREQDIRSVMDVYYPNASVMHYDLVETLREAGVDNLQVFPAEITPDAEMELESEPGIRIPGYLVANVLGMVSCANLDKSEFDMLGSSYVFHRLVLEESRTGNHLLFRLTEYPPDIIVQEQVASRILAKQFRGLQLEKLESI